jgi:phosphoesterase RecJ-like protein
MSLDWAPFVDLVRRRQRFLLTTHIRPDPDGLGSMLGLAAALEQRGKVVQMVVSSIFPPRYNFLDPDRRIQQFSADTVAAGTEAIVVLDTGTWNQLGDFGAFMRQSHAEKVVIDHHLTQDDLGGIRLVDTSAEATGRLVYEVVRALGLPLTPTLAQDLFIAIATDTGWLRHNNTTPATLLLASELMTAGARPTDAYNSLYEQNTLGRLKLVGLILGRLQTAAGGRIAWTEIRREDYAATGAIPQDTEELINYPRSLAGVEIGLMFMEQPRGGVKVSFRSRAGIDVARIAEQFGGGGHRQASGAVFETTLDEARQRILAAATAALGVPPVSPA